MKQLLAFARFIAKREPWLLPIVLGSGILGWLIWLGQSSTLGPFMYTIF